MKNEKVETVISRLHFKVMICRRTFVSSAVVLIVILLTAQSKGLCIYLFSILFLNSFTLHVYTPADKLSLQMTDSQTI